jgi:predicted transcriptional regulator
MNERLPIVPELLFEVLKSRAENRPPRDVSLGMTKVYVKLLVQNGLLRCVGLHYVLTENGESWIRKGI